MPWSVLFGAVVTSVSTLSPVANAGHAIGDIDLMIIEHSGEGQPTLTTAAGYALVTGGHIVINGPGPSASCAALTMFWRRWNGTDGNPTVADIGNHLHGVVGSVRGAVTTGDPWDQVVTSTKGTASTAVSITGATATLADTFVVAACGASLPDLATTTEYSSPANANLTSVTERVDDTTLDGNGGGLLVITGQLATAIPWGATTATSVTSSANANIALNLKPEVAAAGFLPNPRKLKSYPQLLAH